MDGSPSVWIWALGICTAILGVLFVFLLGIVKDHMNRDAKVHEKVAVHDHVISKFENNEHRLTKIETQADINTNEIGKIREMRHDILDDVTKRLSNWYVDLRRAIDNLKGGK